MKEGNDDFNFNTDSMFSNNLGPLRALFQFISILTKDKISLEYLSSLKKKKKRAMSFLSHTFISRVKNNIQKYVLIKVTETIDSDSKSKYAIQLDGSTDVSIKSQCGLRVRFVNKCLNIHNRLVAFIPTAGHSGLDYFNWLKQTLSGLKLDVIKCIGSCTDGASNLRSELKGLTGLLQNLVPKHIFTWCACHRFQLAIQDNFGKEVFLCEMFTHLNDFAVFFRASSIRIDIWRKILAKLAIKYREISPKLMPGLICTTRWWSKHKVLHKILKSKSSLMALLLSIDDMRRNHKLPTKQKEKMENLFKFFSESKNVLKMFVIDRILARLNITSTTMQAADFSFFELVQVIESCTSTFQDWLNSSQIVNEGKIFVNSIRAVLADDYKINDMAEITENDVAQTLVWMKQGLNTLIADINSRFIDDRVNMDEIRIGCANGEDFDADDGDQNNNNVTDIISRLLFKEIALLHPKQILTMAGSCQVLFSIIPEITKLDSHLLAQKLKEFAHDFKTFHQSSAAEGEKEWTTLINFFSSESNQQLHTEINEVYQYILTLPCTQVACERDFSVMKIVKTSRRSAMGDQALENEMITKQNIDLVKKDMIPEIMAQMANESRKLKSLISKC